MAAEKTLEENFDVMASHRSVSKSSDEDFGEFICGWGAAFINITLTFPVNKIMFRQMLHGVETQQAVQQLKNEGIRYLYRGFFPPLIQKTISVSIMFGTYDAYGQMLFRTFPNISSPLCLGTAAILAGSTEALLTPFERIQTLLQDKHYNTKFRNTFHAYAVLKTYGIREFYRGLTPILLRNGPSNVLFFSLRTTLKDNLPKYPRWWGELLVDFISGAVVGAAISTIFYPVNLVKTKMQVCYGTRYVSILEAFRTTYDERGRSIQKLFYGVHINYTRALLSWGIINASYELLRRNFYPQHGKTKFS